MTKIMQMALAAAMTMLASSSMGCSRSVHVEDITNRPSSFEGRTVSLKDVATSHYFWLPDAERGAYEIGGGGAAIWVVADRPTPQTGDTVNLTGVVADNFSFGDYCLGLVIIEKGRRLIYDYQDPTDQPVPTHPPSLPQIERVPSQINLFARPGTDPPAEELSIGLLNEASPEWSIRVDKPWLKVSPTRGELSEGGRVRIQAESSLFPIGEYSATITVRIETEEREVPVRLYVTGSNPGQTIDAGAETGKGTAWEVGIKLDGPVEVSAGILERAMSFAGGPDRRIAYSEGGMAIFVKGTLANNSDNEWQVDYWPEAFDANGNQVAWGLDQGGAPLPGHLQMNIAAHSSKSFILHLTWADDISRITINANKYDPWPPLP